MKVTALRLEDRPRWAELWTGYLKFHETTVPPEQYEFTWTRLHDGRLHGFAARDDDDRMIGLVHYLSHEHCWMMQPICYLQDLFVDPAVRGAGAGIDRGGRRRDPGDRMHPAVLEHGHGERHRAAAL